MADSPQKSALGSASQMPVKHTEAHPHDFHAALEGAMGSSTKVKEFVHLYDKKEYEGMKTFLSPDKASGYAVKPDGDVVSVFSTVKGRGDHLVQHALTNGGNKLDAFDGHLPTLYAKHGFQEYKREKNWTPGGPDVVYMHRPDAKKLAASEQNDHLFAHAMSKADYYKKTHSARNPAPQNSTTIFLAVDGDNAGQLVGRAVLANDVHALHEISNRINHGQDVIGEWAQAHGGTLISAGGDEGNLSVPADSFDMIEQLRADYVHAIGLTLTVGVGSTLSEAGKALIVGKLRGKNQTCEYDHAVEQEYLKAEKDTNEGTATGEAKKLGEAYMKPMKQTEDTHAADCQYCAELATDNVTDEDHCLYCHNETSETQPEPHCEYCAQADQANAQHDPTAEGHADDCQYCAESAAQAPVDAAVPQESASADGSLQAIAAEIEATTQPGETPQDVLAGLDGPADMPGTQMQDNISHPDTYQQNVPTDMGMAEEPVPEQGPDLNQVLATGLDAHSENIQREKVVALVTEALQGFKASKQILERAQEQAPQLYTSSIAMLKAMIEMAKMFGLAPQQQAPAPTEQNSNPQNPQSNPQAQAAPQGEPNTGKSSGPIGFAKLSAKQSTKHVARTVLQEGAINAKGQKKVIDHKTGNTRWIDMKGGMVQSSQGIPVKPESRK